MINLIAHIILYVVVPLVVIWVVFYVYFYESRENNVPKKYVVNFKVKSGGFKIQNIRRGVSIIGSAGSGKTESIVF